MIYKLDCRNDPLKVDSDRIARKFLDGQPLNVHPSTAEERLRLVEFLETEGFSCPTAWHMDREDVLVSKLPLVITFGNKSIARMGNVTCAAQQGLVIGEGEFYLLYSIRKAKHGKWA